MLQFSGNARRRFRLRICRVRGRQVGLMPYQQVQRALKSSAP